MVRHDKVNPYVGFSVKADKGDTSDTVMKKFVFTSDHLPGNIRGHQRAGVWVDSLREIGANFELEIPKTDRFRGETEILPLGDVFLGTALTDASVTVRVYRDKSIVQKRDDDRVQVLINAGDDPMHVRQSGREVVLNRGEISIIGMDDTSDVRTLGNGNMAVVLLPRSRILGGVAAVGDLAARPLVGGDVEVQRLLKGHVNTLLGATDVIDPRIAALAADYLSGLIGALVGPNSEVRMESALRAVPAARLAAVRTALRRRFREPGLTAEIIGASLGLSARYVQHLMQQDGSTFTSELMAMRLEAAHAELLAEPLDRATVTDIAFRCGFSDLSTFYRAFRSRFGQTPNAVRGSGLRG